METYLSGLCETLFGGDVDWNACWKASSEVITSFSTESHRGILLLAKETVGVDVNVAVTLDVEIVSDNADYVAVIKKDPNTFQVHAPIAPQVQILQLYGDDSPFAQLHKYLAQLMDPYLTSWAKRKNMLRDMDSKIGIPAIFQGLTELIGLMQCQQNMSIPETNLRKHLHRAILQACIEKKDQSPEEIVDSMGDELLNSASFLNEIQKSIKDIGKDVKVVIDQENAPVFKSAMDEIHFWSSLDAALANIENQLRSKEVQVTLEILRRSKRFHARLSLENDLGLDQVKEKVKDYHSLLHDFPLQDLLSAKSIDKLSVVVLQIFNHIKKIGKLSNYPIHRAVALIDAVTRDFNDQIIKVLGPQQLLYISFDDFEKATSGFGDLFVTWEQEYRSFCKFAFQLAKRRFQKITEKFTMEHLPLKNRIEQIRSFRRQHNNLLCVLKRVWPQQSGETQSFGSSGAGAIGEVMKAYDDVRQMNNRLLDVSPEGQQLWEITIRQYEERIDRVETHITNKLRDRLGQACTATEMFRVFSKFNALFFRPKIRGAIQTYQTDLILKVKEDIKSLMEKFTAKYDNSEASKMAALRDVPSVSGAIIWAKQIERQLQMYMKRVEDVFGKGWDRLKDLRRVDGMWNFNESLADFMGIPFPKLQDRIASCSGFLQLQSQPSTASAGPVPLLHNEVIGTAMSLAFLDIVFQDSKLEWEAMYEESKELLRKAEKRYSITESTHDAAFALLSEMGVGGQHVEGSNLRSMGDSFRKKINQNVANIIDNWNADIMQHITTWNIFQFSTKETPGPAMGGSNIEKQTHREVIVVGPIFKVSKHEIDGLVMEVNFHPDIVKLIKEIRTMQWLGMVGKVKFDITSTALAAVDVYPHAVSLTETIKTFYLAQSKLSSELEMLLAAETNAVQKLMADGIKLDWEQELELSRVSKFSKQLYEAVSVYSDKVTDMLKKVKLVDDSISTLQSCPLSQSEFKATLGNIQKVLDDMNLASFSNLPQWLETINSRVEDVLLKRLEDTILNWQQQFMSMGEEDKERPKSLSSNFQDAEGTPEGGDGEEDDDLGTAGSPKRISRQKISFDLQTYVMAIKVSNRAMILDPSVAQARQHWTHQLHVVLGWICNLPKVQSSRFDSAVGSGEGQSSLDTTYRGLLSKLPKGLLLKLHQDLESKITEVDNFFQTWVRFQALWDMDAEQIYQTLGNDLHSWMMLLNDIRDARSVMETSDTIKDLGPFQVDYKLIQSKVNLKYDDTTRHILVQFRNTMGTEMSNFYSTIMKERKEIEATNFESLETASAFLVKLPYLKKMIGPWTDLMDVFRQGQKKLERARVKLPEDWLYVDNVAGEWSAFNEVFNRRLQALELKRTELEQLLLDAEKNVDRKFVEYCEEWSLEKPADGSLKPHAAMKSLNALGEKLMKLSSEWDNLCLAKEALDMHVRDEAKMRPMVEELESLKEVWQKLATVWDDVDQLSETPFKIVQPRKVRMTLESVQDRIRQFPNALRTYSSVIHIGNTVKDYIKANGLLSELRSEALKDRHWKMLCSRLKVTWNLQEVTLGDVWAADLIANEHQFRDILRTATGEFALETFLQGVRDCWNEYVLELVDYQKKVKLIKGWDDLFNKVSEHLASVGAMKMSPYFKEFEEEATVWDKKLNTIKVCFDLWVEVQRRWVYLEGIFTGSADIKHQLPMETQKFKTIDSDFMALMRKVAVQPYVVQVIQIGDLQKTLERLHDMLYKIQKALGEYLEKQRAAFPRFYFVGDEDLLDIIGHSKEPLQVMKHLKKMFQGITGMTSKEVNGAVVLTGMLSNEGEEVPFATHIEISKYPKIHEWLTRVEQEMRITLNDCMGKAIQTYGGLVSTFTPEKYLDWMNSYPDQIIQLVSQYRWTGDVESALKDPKDTAKNIALVQDKSNSILEDLARLVLQDVGPIARKKLEHTVMILVYQRDTLRTLGQQNLAGIEDFTWLYFLRLYWQGLDSATAKAQGHTHELRAHVANAVFDYGWEYLGVADKLVQTPLTDKTYLILTQALHSKQGGAPFGPAGTGKTETVKALGSQLGRFVLVFNCDESFDFKAMGRIFVGLCQVGAWGCFDEFNRLQERILSAVSQQIQIIQEGLGEHSQTIELIGREVGLNQRVGIFVTMNPGYAGRSKLPDNLKQLFRSVAMTSPDRELIAQVMLYSQGFRTAEVLARKVVPLFQLCKDQLSQQSHYDFGLRALKSVLVSAGNLNRASIQDRIDSGDETTATDEDEAVLLLNSVSDTITPKLVADDLTLFRSLLSDVFPEVKGKPSDLGRLVSLVEEAAKLRFLTPHGPWMEKVLQLYQIQRIQHGVMLVGPSGTGKTMAWSCLMAALEKFEGVESNWYVIDPKALTKDELYGSLDPTTREWVDGVFTSILRRIIDNVKESNTPKRHWIFFDGDVDPEWVENLNSVLDDNKLLTLPNGERLALPSNVRIMFEVQDLKSATLATVSRCGMVWFSDDIITSDLVIDNYLGKLTSIPIEKHQSFSNLLPVPGAAMEGKNTVLMKLTTAEEDQVSIQKQCVKLVRHLFMTDDFVQRALDLAIEELPKHTIMEWNTLQALQSFFSLVDKGVKNIVEYNQEHPDFPLEEEILSKYLSRRIATSIAWGFAGPCSLQQRTRFCELLMPLCPSYMDVPGHLIDFDVELTDGDWVHWKSRVPTMEIDATKVGTNDLIIATMDTVRHEDILLSWMNSHTPLLLCGPPGSGKTMTLTSVLRYMPEYEPVFLNFSSQTQPDMIIKTFEQYCEYSRTGDGVLLRPQQRGKWLVVFCDEINLPAPDKYGTQRVITFMRQLTERGGFFRPSDMQWITLDRIQFVGACNPPTDPGRTPMTHRFLRFAPLLFVDFPSFDSLIQIYGSFTRALLKPYPNLRTYSEPLTTAMVEFYSSSQKRFTPDIQPHYVYSPRELSRWSRAIGEGLLTYDVHSVSQLGLDMIIRLVVHEGLRLFQDRLVNEQEREWTDEAMDTAVLRNFPTLDRKVIERPILFTTFLTKEYTSVDREELRQHVQGKLKVFAEEELDVQLVVFDSVLDHICRIDRVLRQPLGHCLLAGVAGAGKTVLSRYVAWMNGQSVFQIKAHRGYTLMDFEDDLRSVLKRAGGKGERICFIFDESNIMDSGFLEYMNALLAAGEVPGLFDGEEYSQLINMLKESAGAANVITSDEGELYRWFVSQVQRNLHIVFTMNPQSPDFANRSATSPALFNRCTIDWFGEWSPEALAQVAEEYTMMLDLLGDTPDSVFETREDCQKSIVKSITSFHKAVQMANSKLELQSAGKGTFITPRHYLDFICQFRTLFHEKREEVQEQQRHLNTGLQKLRDTEDEVKVLQASLKVKEAELRQKENEANDKLQQMVIDQQEAEKSQAKVKQLAEELVKTQNEVEQRKAQAQEELACAEPALKEAEAAVSTIKTSQLQEIRAYASPPATIKKVLSAVLMVLGEKKADAWDVIKSYTRKDDFIPSIRDFNSKKITEAQSKKLKETYLTDPTFTYEVANKASKACGPLLKWVVAQIDYSEILHKIKPLRSELEQLEQQLVEGSIQSEKLKEEVIALEARVQALKIEYASLVSESQRLKTEMESVNSKVERAMHLMVSLSQERQRWEFQSSTFTSQMGTVLGDCLLSAGFVAYIGYYDEHYRNQILMPEWQDILDGQRVDFKRPLSITEYLSRPDERLVWGANKLPTDNLCIENAIILQRFRRYPLIIDPSGQAITFLMNQYKSKNINKTSFLDSGFMKTLESALRFGTPLLVQDVEAIDPILNPILNKEVRRTGGRHLMRLGDQDVDLSPTFNIFLSTRDPTARFAPDLCGRVTMVNFTITPSSLQAQCLNKTLKSERPDVEEKRSDIMKLQGEYKMRLRILEQNLLKAISDSSGNILENDELIQTLETLKTEAKEIEGKMQNTEQVMNEISEVNNFYSPLALACSRVYFTLEQLADLHSIYMFSLPFFFRIVDDILYSNPRKDSRKDPKERIQILLHDLFQVTFKRVSRSLVQKDHLTLALRLSQIRLKVGDLGNVLVEDEVEFLLRTGQGAVSPRGVPDYICNVINSPSQRKMVSELLQIQTFDCVREDLKMHPESWKKFVVSPTPTKSVPKVFQSAGDFKSNVALAFRNLLLMKVFRPDGLYSATHDFVSAIFDTEETKDNTFLDLPPTDLKALVDEEADAYTPLMLCAAPGTDPSVHVDILARNSRVNLLRVAMGSPEGFDEADKVVSTGVKTGQWVMLKNVHLAADWLGGLEKRLHGLQLEAKAAPNFRLFLTAEIHTGLPANLLSRSLVLVYEPPPGVKPNLQRTYLASGKAEGKPAELERLRFAAAWLHAWVVERMSYTPMGWSKGYEISEGDLRWATVMIEQWVASAAKGRSNLNPDQLPWKAMTKLLSVAVYGSRIDNEYDQRLLTTFVERLFCPTVYNTGYKLTDSSAGSFSLPDGHMRKDFTNFVSALPNEESPEWLGLPANSREIILARDGKEMLRKLLRIQNVFEDDSHAADTADPASPTDTSTTSFSGKPQWAHRYVGQFREWEQALADIDDKLFLEYESQGENNPIMRSLKREVPTMNSLVRQVKSDVTEMVQICEGHSKMKNHHRTLLQCLTKDILPSWWMKFPSMPGLTVSAWISDLARRAKRLAELTKIAPQNYHTVNICLGLLLFPDAFITATRQAVARAFSWSLESLELHVDIGVDTRQSRNDAGFNIVGLTFEGAAYKNGMMVLLQGNELSSEVPATRLSWKQKDDNQDLRGKRRFPVYLNGARSAVLCEVVLAVDPTVPGHVWYERGCCMVTWKGE